LPINLLQLVGAYTSEAITETIVKTLKAYSITYNKLGYFVLNNAANNNTAIAVITCVYNFNTTY
jgi:hypothetical protein